MERQCLVVNLFGAPGSGKSTGAAYIFSRLKMAGINAELVTEFAKDKVWENDTEVFKPDNQCYLFGKQFYRMSRCRDKVSVIVTDSPLPLSAYYNESSVLGEAFNQTVMNCFNSFKNISYMVLRDKPYNPIGRRHSEAESNEIKGKLIELLESRKIPFKFAEGCQRDYDAIVNEVMEALNEEKSNETF